MSALENTAAPPPRSPSTTSRINTETIESALNALLKWRTAKSNTEKPQLFDQEEDFLYLILTLKKIPTDPRTNAHKIPLPHPLHSPISSDLCLIIDDRPNSLTSSAAKQKIKSDNIPITKVLKLSKLKSNYKPFEAKRKLCDSYHMFFADKRVIHLLPRLLGKEFFKKKKIPVPVDLSYKNWKEQIDKACSSALLYFNTGTCSVVRVAKVGMETGEIVENVVRAVKGAADFVPRKWDGVRSFHLKFSESLALPIYQVLPEVKLRIEGVRKLEEEEGGEKLGIGLKKKKMRKGRIHEVRYMDEEVGELGVEDEDEDEEGIEVSEKKIGGKKVGSKLNGEKRSKMKGRVHEVRYMDDEVGEDGGDELGIDDDDEEEEEEEEEIEVSEKKIGGKKVGSKLNGEKRSKKSDSKSKKGRIHEVRYMDDDDDDEEEEEEVIEVREKKIGGKKRKEGGLGNEKVASKLDGEKRLKKLDGKAEKGKSFGEKKVKNKESSGAGKIKDKEAKKVKDKKSKKKGSAE